jgi:hypothetical protein
MSVKRAIAWVVGGALFWAGHIVSRPMNVWRFGMVYPVYHRLMCWSVAVDDWGGGGIHWGQPDSKTQ